MTWSPRVSPEPPSSPAQPWPALRLLTPRRPPSVRLSSTLLGRPPAPNTLTDPFPAELSSPGGGAGSPRVGASSGAGRAELRGQQSGLS